VDLPIENGGSFPSVFCMFTIGWIHIDPPIHPKFTSHRFKGNFTGKPHDLHGKIYGFLLWFSQKKQSIEKETPAIISL